MGFSGQPPTSTVKASRLSLLESLLSHKNPSLIALQEAPPETIAILNKHSFDTEQEAGLISGLRRTDWISYKPTSSVPNRALGLRLDNTNGVARISWWNVHLRSRYMAQDTDIRNNASSVVRHIDKLRLSPGWDNRLEIISGDFNLPPYDEIFMTEQGFNANRSLEWAQKQKKKPGASNLYHPTWLLLGLSTPPQGSYYATSSYDKPWYLYDQALIAPELAHTGLPTVEILSTVAGTALCHNSIERRPNKTIGSDHLPVCTHFSVE